MVYRLYSAHVLCLALLFSHFSVAEAEVEIAKVDANGLQEEVNQTLSRQGELLQEFLQDHAEHPLHHWSKGEVWNGKEWVKHDLIVEQGGRWHEVYRYQQERSKRTDNFRDNLFLADGCRSHELGSEERAHLERVLLHDYSFHEAHQRLGHVNINGFWVTPRQIHLTLRENRRREANLQNWSEDVIRLQKTFSETRPGSVAEEKTIATLMKIRTPDAIPAMERFFASQGVRETRVFQDWLVKIESHEAAETLIRQAVFHNSSVLRTRAAKYLRGRRFDEYIPYALSGMTSVKTRYQLDLVQLPLALPTIPLKVFSKQVVVDSFDKTLTVNGTRTIVKAEPVAARFADIIWMEGPTFSRDQVPQVVAQANAGIGSVLLADYGKQVMESPQKVRIDRIMRTLSTATQTELEEPEEWFEWWRKQNDLVLEGGKLQLNDNYDDGVWYVDNRRVQRADRLTITQTQTSSCFVEKTLVETEHGPRPIQEIQIGDRVLSQETETGLLTFKPVLDRTVREKAPTVIVKTSSEEIQCSLGHPFWVVGYGWRMAKELELGMALHTLYGQTVDVTEIEPAKNETVYNLIVADFSTYFAGEQNIYTHDVTPRASTDMVLPGIRKTFD